MYQNQQFLKLIFLIKIFKFYDITTTLFSSIYNLTVLTIVSLMILLSKVLITAHCFACLWHWVGNEYKDENS